MILTNFLRVVFNWWTPDQCTERRKNIKRLRSIICKQQNNSYFCHKANRESNAWELFLSSCKYLDKWSVWPRVQADQNKRMKSSKILVHTGQWPVMLHLARLSNIKKNFFPIEEICPGKSIRTSNIVVLIVRGRPIPFNNYKSKPIFPSSLQENERINQEADYFLQIILLQ